MEACFLLIANYSLRDINYHNNVLNNNNLIFFNTKGDSLYVRNGAFPQ